MMLDKIRNDLVKEENKSNFVFALGSRKSIKISLKKFVNESVLVENETLKIAYMSGHIPVDLVSKINSLCVMYGVTFDSKYLTLYVKVNHESMADVSKKLCDLLTVVVSIDSYLYCGDDF